LRRSCPARSGDHVIDVKVAKRLLADPVLYSQAVHAIGASPSVAAVPAAAGPPTVEPALTAVSPGLSSSPRNP
jgi:hypothetical protein